METNQENKSTNFLNQWNKKLVTWKDQKNWQIFSTINQEKRRRIQISKELKENYYQPYRNKKEKGILWIIVHQWIRPPGRNKVTESEILKLFTNKSPNSR